MPAVLTFLKEMRVVVAAIAATLLTLVVVHGARGGSEAAFTPTSAPAAGQVYVGGFSAYGNGGYIGQQVDLPNTMTYAIKSGRYQYVIGTSYTAQCPGPNKVVPTGYLCLYETASSGTSFGASFDPATDDNTTGRRGFSLYWYATGSSNYAYGSWALKVGNLNSAPTSGAAKHGAKHGLPKAPAAR